MATLSLEEKEGASGLLRDGRYAWRARCQQSQIPEGGVAKEGVRWKCLREREKPRYRGDAGFSACCRIRVKKEEALCQEEGGIECGVKKYNLIGRRALR